MSLAQTPTAEPFETLQARTRTGVAQVLIDSQDADRLRTLSPRLALRLDEAASGKHRRGYVRLSVWDREKRTSEPLIVARFITGAPRGAFVSYRNGDPLDLRRGNLKVTEPAATRDRATEQQEATQ